MKASLVKAGAVDPNVVVRDGISELNEVLARQFDGAGGRAGENGTVVEKHVIASVKRRAAGAPDDDAEAQPFIKVPRAKAVRSGLVHAFIEYVEDMDRCSREPELACKEGSDLPPNHAVSEHETGSSCGRSNPRPELLSQGVRHCGTDERRF
jgi:hypothetical protein